MGYWKKSVNQNSVVLAEVLNMCGSTLVEYSFSSLSAPGKDLTI